MDQDLGGRLPEGSRPGLSAPEAVDRSVHPPLALYVHIPWCVRKCPYCDFNSHPRSGALPEAAYVGVLLRDLARDVDGLQQPRPLTSIFIGGGTPSLFSGDAIARLLRGVREIVDVDPGCEITLEANPGAAEAESFAAYRDAGVNRLSIGVQSLAREQLRRLGRIHSPQEAVAAVAMARAAGFTNLNLDLMYGLPGQTLDEARRDLSEILALGPEHLSYYQLTLEPNTAFFASPPDLPDHDLTADMQLQGGEMLGDEGYAQYEVSAYARHGHRCRHNLNYWEFGDYLGIGAGAHGKVTDGVPARVCRRAKLRHPAAYMDPANLQRLVSARRTLHAPDLISEFALNALRLVDGFAPSLFERRTGLGFARIAGIVDAARDDGLLEATTDRVRPTMRGSWFLNDLIARFMPG